jgi:hypothetical protein
MRAGIRIYWPWLLGGAVWAVALVILILALVTRTTWGHERVLGFTLETLGGQLNGTLKVERLTGNVFTGARLYEISLVDEDGEPLMSADSAFIEYRLPTFLGGDVVIQHLELFSPRLSLVRMPGDTLWNYQRVLQAPDERDPLEIPRATLIEWMRVVDARISIGMEWVADPDLTPREQDALLRGALTDTARLVAVAVPSGHLRMMSVGLAAATISELFIGADERGGTYLKVDTAQGEVRLWRDPPLQLRHLTGELNLREGVMRFNSPRVVFPASELRAVGEVDLREGEPKYHVVISGEQIAFADMQWLYPRFPDEGGGALRLRLLTREDGFYFFARDIDLRAPGTRVRGQFGMLLGDTVRFVDPDLVAEPLNMRTVEQLLPTGLPVRGLVIGGAEIQTPES